MSKINKNKLLAVLFILLITVVFISGCIKTSAPQKGQLAPAIKENTLDGRSVALSDYKGKIVVVNFWGMWCGYCVQEMPEFNRAAQAYPDVVFLMINTSNNLKYEDISEIKKFLNTNDLSFENILLNTKAAGTYQVRAFPTTFIIGKDGKISDFVTGAINYDTLAGMINEAGR